MKLNFSMCLERDALLNTLKPFIQKDYKLIEIVGQGGTSYVIKVENKSLKRIEALKVISLENATDTKIIQRFDQEAKILADLRKNYSNLHIPEIFRYKKWENLFFYTMEFIDGKSLEKIMQQKKSRSIKDSLYIVAQLANILEVIHSEGIIHRDIKPANIILQKKIEPWLVDFGLLKIIDSVKKITDRGARLGTPTYMSPEQVMGSEKISEATDIYSLGAVFYEMLTGKSYIIEKSVAGIFYSIVYDELKLPSDLLNDIPTHIDDICARTLHKNPKKRYSSAKNLRKDIEKYLDKL